MRIKASLDYTNEALWLCCCLLFVLKDIKHINKSDHSLKRKTLLHMQSSKSNWQKDF